MIWSHLREEDFGPAVQKSGGLCVIPIGSLEMHGQHLPVGTDMLIANSVLHKAASLEPVLVFPDFTFGDVQGHTDKYGGIRLSVPLLQQLLTELCQEIARNGFKKILLFNCHGGNGPVLANFINSTFQNKKDYVVMSYNNKLADPYTMVDLLRKKGRAQLAELEDADIKVLEAFVAAGKSWGHAGFAETAAILGSHPELVRMDKIKALDGLSTGRADFLEEQGINGGFWGINFPNAYAGHAPEGCTERIGRCAVRIMAENLAQVLAVLKETDVMLDWNAEHNRAWL